MTIRDEEILNASTVYHEEQFHCDGWNYDFVEGAEWADQHPRKGLWDSEKVCKWIEEHLSEYITLENDEEGELQTVCYQRQFIDDLYKSMED